MLVILALVLLVLFWAFARKNDKQVLVGKYRTTNFNISPDSRQMFDKMKRNGMPESELEKFAILEDRFLECEKDCACRGIKRELEATSLDQSIRELFSPYDFSYHMKHLVQAHEPSKIINPNLKCYSV